MDIRIIAPDLSVSPQIQPQDASVLASLGYRAVFINRPDGESDDQPGHEAIREAAERAGLEVRYIPVVSGKVTDADVDAFRKAMSEAPAPAVAYCRTGTRSTTLWALSQAGHLSADAILKTARDAGYDLSNLSERLRAAEAGRAASPGRRSESHDVVIVGGGAAGITAASCLLKRRPGLNIAIVEPRSEHYYQPGWTLVGGGVFKREQTRRDMADLIPRGVSWIRTACAGFDPEASEVILEDGGRVGYQALIAAPGLKLDWEGVEGLKESLGRFGVTSNYLFDMAPYTWELVNAMEAGRALFTQPPMPIKCAGAPQKAMYLACDAWRRKGVLGNIDVSFHNAGGVLFGVKDYVPALMGYVERYGIDLHFNEKLVKVDGPAKEAVFERTDENGVKSLETRGFDMIHVCPPQTGLDFVRSSPLADAAGWIEVDGETMQHVRYGNVYALGDAGSTPNAKTAAAVRKQAPVVAENVIRTLDGKPPHAVYNGYGSCPLTVERGKIVLAEFAYGGKLDPSFPKWLVDGTKPTRLAWLLKEKLLPWIYFDLMLKGDETLAGPTILPHRPHAREAQAALPR
jgi:sulfide:quinone oxidoreductase